MTKARDDPPAGLGIRYPMMLPFDVESSEKQAWVITVGLEIKSCS